MPRRRNPYWLHGSSAFVLCLLLTIGTALTVGARLHWAVWLASLLVSVNLVTFAYYGYDKWRARRGSNRVPEAVLHGLTIFGGALGAYAGMRFFRHKTIKGRFRLLFWFIVVAQVLLVSTVLYRLVR